ncbi:hypothetical protein, partial [Acidithiobacillus thiooxidans]|uniref:hypothetical protein n=1 Tax=Acidithiobacillus thiooxidans TaxID=930 RepID=UPI001C394DEE
MMGGARNLNGHPTVAIAKHFESATQYQRLSGGLLCAAVLRMVAAKGMISDRPSLINNSLSQAIWE